MGITAKCQDIWAFVSFWFMQMELNTATYMMEPAEKLFITVLIVAVFGAMLYGCVTFLPGHLIMMMHFFHLSADDTVQDVTGNS